MYVFQLNSPPSVKDFIKACYQRWPLLLILIFVYLLLPGFVFGQDSQDINSVQQLFIQLRSSDKRQSSQAAQALGNYAYVEVNQALIQVATAELNEPHPNSFVVGNAIKSLISLVVPQDIQGLRSIRSQIQQLLDTGAINSSLSYIYIAAEVDQAIQVAQGRRNEDLPRLTRQPTLEDSSLERITSESAESGILSDKPLLKETLREALINNQDPSVQESAKVMLENITQSNHHS